MLWVHRAHERTQPCYTYDVTPIFFFNFGGGLPNYFHFAKPNYFHFAKPRDKYNN